MKAVNGTNAIGWLEQRAHCVLTPKAKAIAVVDGAGRICAMAAYDAITRGSCEMHFALDTPHAGRALLGAAFDYPFKDLGLCVLLGMIPADNTKSLRLAQHLGFRETYRVRSGWTESVDLVIHEMRRDECRWLSGRKAA